MTKLVNGFNEQLILQFKETGIFSEIEAEERTVSALMAHLKSLIENRQKKTAEVIELLRKIA